MKATKYRVHSQHPSGAVAVYVYEVDGRGVEPFILQGADEGDALAQLQREDIDWTGVVHFTEPAAPPPPATPEVPTE